MNSESLIPLARAVAHRVSSLEARLEVRIGTIHLDLEVHPVMLRGAGL